MDESERKNFLKRLLEASALHALIYFASPLLIARSRDKELEADILERMRDDDS